MAQGIPDFLERQITSDEMGRAGMAERVRTLVLATIPHLGESGPCPRMEGACRQATPRRTECHTDFPPVTTRPHVLESGGRLANVSVAYETWGELAADRSNAVLVLHALTGDSHVCGPAGAGHRQPGWWERVVGPGLAVDTNRFFVVCPNVLGGCQGTTGPAADNAATGEPYGSTFPVVTIRDQVVVECALAHHLRIDRWSAVIGGSMGGQRALEWAVSFPDRVPRAVIVACGAQATAEEIALCALQIRVFHQKMSRPTSAKPTTYIDSRNPRFNAASCAGG